MKLPRFISSTSVRETGLVRAQDIGALTNVGDAEFRAIQQAGQAIGHVSDVGFRAFMSRQALDDDIKMGEASVKVKEAEGLEITAIQSRNFIAEETRPDDPEYWKGGAGYDVFEKMAGIKAAQASYRSKITKLSSVIKNPNTRKQWENQQLNTGYTNIEKAYNAKHDDYQRTKILGNAETSAANGDIDLSNQWIDIALKHGLVTHAKSVAERKKNKELFADELINDVSNQAFAIWQETGDISDALEIIEQSDVPGGDKQEVESELKTRILIRKAVDKDALAQRQEEELNEINQAIFFDRDYGKAKLAVENSSLSEKEQGVLFSDIDKRANAAAKGLPLANDRVEEARLFDLSLKIWNGTISKPEFDKELSKNANKLDDSAYQRISSSASTTLKSSQAEAATRASSETRSVLVDFVTEDAMAAFIADSVRGLAPDVAQAFTNNANEERQLQFWSLSRYNSEIRQWLEENPDKLSLDALDFYMIPTPCFWLPQKQELALGVAH